MTLVAAGSSVMLASNRLYGITIQKTTILIVNAFTSKTHIAESLERKYDLQVKNVKKHLKNTQTLSHKQEHSSGPFCPSLRPYTLKLHFRRHIGHRCH